MAPMTNQNQTSKVGRNFRGAFTITPRVRIRKGELRRLRRGRGLTQPEVERACRIAGNVLTAYECGRLDMPLPIARRLAAYYGVPVTDLLSEESVGELMVACRGIADALGAQITFHTSQQRDVQNA